MQHQPEVLIVGTGRHAKVVIELFQAEKLYHIAGLVGVDVDACRILNVPVVGTDSDLTRLRRTGIEKAFVAIGDNRKRLSVGRQLVQQGFDIVNAVSPSAVVSPSTRLGCGIAIMAGAVINADTRIGDFVVVNTRASVDHDGVIGEGAHIGPGTTLAGNVEVGRLAFLGVGTNVIPGRSIGEGAVLGAGSCVVRDIPRDSLARGVPARVVSIYDRSS